MIGCLMGSGHWVLGAGWLIGDYKNKLGIIEQ